ncbi:MAG: CinA family protein [Pseudomonadota bacterium]
MTFDEELTVIAGEVIKSFGKAGMTIATAESCTGGLIGGCLTSVSGSSEVFDRGFITYSNEAKAQSLGVDPALIEEHGAVSAQVASEMAIGAVKAANVDAAVAVTGIAGPGGGTEKKPVGLVYIAVALSEEEGAFVEDFLFADMDRDGVRRETVKEALEMLLGYGLDDDE